MNSPLQIVLADSHGPVVGKDQTSANLSLLYLGSYLRAQPELDVELTYIPQVKDDAFHLRTVQERNADVYASSFTSYSARSTFELIRQIKATSPHTTVICGGPHVTNSPHDTLTRSGCDVCVIGEGELTFHELLHNLHQLPSALPQIAGVAYLQGGELHQTPARPLIQNIDTVPFPARDLVNDDDFCGLTYSKARPNTEMVVTRGCPLRCVFCANPVFRLASGPLFRSRSPENIAAEAEQLYQHGYREIYIHSDEINVELEWSIEVCKALAKLGHKDLYFQTNLRVVPMSDELAYWLGEANFWLVRIGVESTSNRVLAGIKKRMSFEKTVDTFRTLRGHGIKIFAFCMLFNYWEDNGELQHDTLEECRQTIRDMYGLWRRRLLNYTSWAFAVPVQGAELYDIARKRQMVDENFYPDDVWDSFDHLRDISRGEFNQVYAAARRQQAVMALTAGNIEWRNYRSIARRAYTALLGKPGRK